GESRMALVGYDDSIKAVPLWQSDPCRYAGPVPFQFEVGSGAVSLGSDLIGRVPVPLKGRRLCWTFSLLRGGDRLSRTTGHYLSHEGQAIDQRYYYGDDYVDYEAQSAGELATIRRLMRQYTASGR